MGATAKKRHTMDTNDELARLLAAANTDPDAVAHSVSSTNDAVFTWDYERSRAPLSKLYEKAKTSQWNATTDLPWHTDVDLDAVAAEIGGRDARARLVHRLTETD